MLIDAEMSFFTLDGVGTPQVVNLETAYASWGRPIKCFIEQDGAADIAITDCATVGGSYTLLLTITGAPVYTEFYLPTDTKQFVLVSTPATQAANKGGVILDGQTNG